MSVLCLFVSDTCLLFWQEVIKNRKDKYRIILEQTKTSGIRAGTALFRLYDGKEPTTMSKDKAYHTIQQLKGLVSALGIGIHSVRGKGTGWRFPQLRLLPRQVLH